ncbi:MAG TPA: hypothetical protein VM864_02540 [Pyrinomonadaceae bacterium]|jgi:hypothetical protein|nr:hypothetical protein [Pyrinomonadaceae bacterium]
MQALVALAKALFGKLSYCSKSGALAGLVAGFFCALGLLQLAETPMSLSTTDLFKGGLALGLLAWLVLLLVIGVLLRYGLKQVALFAFIIAVITALLTVFINYAIQVPVLAVLIGLLVGILVGLLLCWFCRRR